MHSCRFAKILKSPVFTLASRPARVDSQVMRFRTRSETVKQHSLPHRWMVVFTDHVRTSDFGGACVERQL